MVYTIGIYKHAIGIVHKSLWWAEMDLRAQRAAIIPWYWCASGNVRLRVRGCRILAIGRRVENSRHSYE